MAEEILEVLEETAETEENNEQISSDDQTDDDTSDAKSKNESNFKKLYKAHKEDQKRISELEEAIAYLSTKDDSKPNDEVPEDKFDKIERRIFLSENKDASKYLDEINKVKNRYWMDYEEAWTLVKAKTPAESKTKVDFDMKSSPIVVKKTLADISPEEALKLKPDQLEKWQKLHWYA